MQNILGINPYQERFYDVVLSKLQDVLGKATSVDDIEIQIKYAEFKYFCPLTVDLNEVSSNQQIRKIIENFRGLSYRSTSSLSNQAIILLNPLGRDFYSISSGFNQIEHLKYYHIRNFFMKLCLFNSQHNYKKIPLTETPANIYHEMSQIGSNHLLKLIQKNQIRLDLYVKDRAPERLRGRYSFSSINGWKKTNKSPLCEQQDFMLAQRIFRFAINKQIQTDVSQSDLAQIADYMKNANSVDIRLKNILRVHKGEICEFSLSQIYNIKNLVLTKLQKLPQYLVKSRQELQIYLKKIFGNFYSMSEEEYTKYEIESQFTKAHTRKLKSLVQKRKFRQLQNEIQLAIYDLYALFWVDNKTKRMQQAWFDKFSKRQMPHTRLQNQFGSYMRDQLYSRMNE